MLLPKPNYQTSYDSARLAVSPGEEALVFIHLYKTAGTTLNRIIEWEYPLRRICSIEPNWWEWHFQRITRWRPERLQRMDVFKGHMPFGLHRVLPRPAVYVTVLRDPVERAISDYYFARRFIPHRHHRAAQTLSLEQYFLHKHEHSLQSRMLAGGNSRALFSRVCDASVLNKAKENLASRFAVVGLTERFDETLALLKISLGWKIKRYRSFRVSHNRLPNDLIPDSTIRLIREKERFDLEIYDYAVTLFERTVAAHKREIRRELRAIQRAKKTGALESRYYLASSVTRAAITRAHSLF